MRYYPQAVIGLLGFLALITAKAESVDPITPTMAFSEISRKVVNVGDHKVTYVRVRQPVLPPTPSPPPTRAPTEEEIAAAERLATKEHITLNITATVYLKGNQAITEIKWRSEASGNLEYSAYSNTDFRYLTQLTHLETETTVYAWFSFVSVCDLTHLPAHEMPWLPPDLSLGATESDYFVDARAKNNKNEEATLAGLDYLHAYYQIHAAKLKDEHEKRIAYDEARAKETQSHIIPKSDTVIRYWRINSSGDPR